MFDNNKISRETARTIKRMNTEELQKFLMSFFQDAYDRAVTETFDLDKLKERLSKVKGIGESRLSEIMNVIEEYVKEAKVIK